MDLQKLRSDILASASRYLLMVLSSLILIPIITKFIGTETYGVWTTLISALNLFILVGAFHFQGTLVRFISLKEDEGKVFSHILSLSAVSSILSGIVFYVIVKYTGVINTTDGLIRSNAIIIGGSTIIIFGIIQDIFLNYPRAVSNIKQFEVLVSLRLLFRSLGLVSIVYFTKSITVAVWYLVILNVIITIALGMNYWPGKFELMSKPEAKEYLNYSIPMIPMELSTKLLSNADRIIIIFLMGPAAAGIYSASYAVISIFNKSTNILNPSFYPAISNAWDQEQYGEIRVLYNDLIRYYSMVAIPALIGIIFLASPLLRLLSTNQIALIGSSLIPLLGIGFIFRGMEDALAHILTASRDTQLISGIIISAAIMNIILNIVFIPKFGLIAAAGATVIAQIFKSATFY